MASDAVNTSSWKYANWESTPNLKDRLEKLILHKGEVRQAIIETSQKGRSVRMPNEYMQLLVTEQERLEQKIALETQKTEAATRGPLVIRPRF